MKRSWLLPAAAICALGMSVGSARGVLITYPLDLNGPNEPTASPGLGTGLVTFDTDAHSMRVQVSFSGLVGTTTASHIHAATAAPYSGTAGVATVTPTFVGFPLGVTSGTYDMTYDMTLASSYNPAFVTANGGTAASAEAALLAAAAAGKSYLNIHSSSFPGGEIRGFLPEPTIALAVPAALLAVRRRRA